MIQEQFIEDLPVFKICDKVNGALAERGRIVVTAPPGSGKSTLLPLTILEHFSSDASTRKTDFGKIIMLEPRRAAARQIAMRMAQILGETVGKTVGYRMRFESKVSDMTRIEVVTEGIMERMLIDDPTLAGTSVVIFDEFHERSLTSDLCLALTLEAQNIIRPDLRIVLMSATIDTDFICNKLDALPIKAEGSMFPVKIVNGESFDIRECAEAVASSIRVACREQTGNILAFLPGQWEIARCAEILADSLHDALILPLHGMLSSSEQYRAIEYNPQDRRKIILSTPIAETSLTIEGIRTVVDSGLYRAVRFDSSTGLSRLETVRISLDMARQRAGRAGRLSEGVCYRLWSRADEYRMAENRKPEIEEADLSPTLLDIAAWGCGKPEELPWLTPPTSGHIAEARRLLTMLGAIDENGKITPHGRSMASMPCHPRIAHMLLRATDSRMRSLAADIAAILEEKDPISDGTDADINTRIDLLRQKRTSGPKGPWNRICRISEQYRRMIRCQEDNSPVNPVDSGLLIAAAYPERVAMRLRDNIYRLPSGENIRLDERDNLMANDFLSVATLGKRIFLASPVNTSTLEDMATPFRNISWNSREGRLLTRNDQRVGVLVISSRPLNEISREEIVSAIAQAAPKDGLSMFDFNDDVSRMQRRIEIVSEWHPELNLPDISTSAILSSASEWLPLHIGSATTVQELHKIDLCIVIGTTVGYDMMARIDRIAPSHIRLPGGRNVRIDYRSGTSIPVVSARLQDCFGLMDTPRLDEGRRPVLMELLSPGFKPVQLTTDLRGFWTKTYFEVRKELRRRYPKHRWPDDPLNIGALK